MLQISSNRLASSGGVLSALSEESAAYVSKLVEEKDVLGSSEKPAKIIVHKAPHLDEYFAAFMFRCSQSANDRSVPFLERGLHWDVDLTAEAEWPHSAVFGFGADRDDLGDRVFAVGEVADHF